MSQKNVDVARKTLDALNRRDRAAWLALNDPESECIPPRDWPESDPGSRVWEFYIENFGHGVKALLRTTNSSRSRTTRSWRTCGVRCRARRGVHLWRLAIGQ